MISGKVTPSELTERVETLERELEGLRRALSALARSVSERRIEQVIEEIADHPLSEAEMEEAFKRLDAAIDAAP